MNQKSLVLTMLFVVKYSEHFKFKKLAPSKYDSKIVHSVSAMEKLVNVQSPDLIIVDRDLVKTESDVDFIRVSATARQIPIILLCNSPQEAAENLTLGVADFFAKPVIPALLLNRIEIHMKLVQDIKLLNSMNIKIHEKLQERSIEAFNLQTSIVGVLSELIEFRDVETETHNLRTQEYVNILIRTMLKTPNLYQKEVMLWDIDSHVYASQLHDIGKIGIPDSILLSKAPLSSEEYDKIKEHVMIGVRIIDKILKRTGSNTYLEIAKKYIMYHHEYWDGNGYPNRLSGTNIPLEGRILAVVDVYDALTSPRPYKCADSHDTAVEMINYQSGTQFDPEIVRIFNMVSDQFKDMNL